MHSRPQAWLPWCARFDGFDVARFDCHRRRDVYDASIMPLRDISQACREAASTGCSMFCLLTVALALLCGADARAQSGGGFDLSWFTIDGGGGTSSGGAYTISGTIGQPDAGLLSGGPYTLLGGFWGVVQTEGAPLLRITRAGANVILSWPDPSTGFQLQQASLLGPAISWMNVSQSPSVTGGEKRVTLPIGAGNQFFRLQKP